MNKKNEKTITLNDGSTRTVGVAKAGSPPPIPNDFLFWKERMVAIKKQKKGKKNLVPAKQKTQVLKYIENELDKLFEEFPYSIYELRISSKLQFNLENAEYFLATESMKKIIEEIDIFISRLLSLDSLISQPTHGSSSLNVEELQKEIKEFLSSLQDIKIPFDMAICRNIEGEKFYSDLLKEESLPDLLYGIYEHKFPGVSKDEFFVILDKSTASSLQFIKECNQQKCSPADMFNQFIQNIKEKLQAEEKETTTAPTRHVRRRSA